MSMKFRVGYCINCGRQAYARNFKGDIMSAFPGTNDCFILLKMPDGKECRVGTFPVCKECDPFKLDVEEVKKALFSVHHSGVNGKEAEWGKAESQRIEVVRTFNVEVNRG